jgi:hypothetical protein
MEVKLDNRASALKPKREGGAQKSESTSDGSLKSWN